MVGGYGAGWFGAWIVAERAGKAAQCVETVCRGDAERRQQCLLISLKSAHRVHPSQATWYAEVFRAGFKRVVSNLLKTDIKSLKTELRVTVGWIGSKNPSRDLSPSCGLSLLVLQG